jgi:hypothetical protein
MIDVGATESTSRGRLALHIGPRKTGTSSLQHAFSSNRERLRELGVVYPGERPQHHIPVNRFLGRRQRWEDDFTTAVDERPWQRMLSDIGEAPTAIVSSEVLSQARHEHVVRIVESSPPTRQPLVVITYRSYETLLSSTWQQLIKEGLREPLDSWARRTVEDRPEQTNAPFPRVLDLATLVTTWGSVVGFENVAVVLVDVNRPRAVFDAFEDLLALPEGSLSIAGSAPRKRSMSAEEAELLRQTNELVTRENSLAAYRAFRAKVVDPLLDQAKANPGDHEIALASDVAERARRRACAMVEQLKELPVSPKVYGDLDAIASPSQNSSRATVPLQQAPTVAAHLIAGAIQLSLATK